MEKNVLPELSSAVSRVLNNRIKDRGGLSAYTVDVFRDPQNKRKFIITMNDESHDHGHYPMRKDIDFAISEVEKYLPRFDVVVSNRSTEEIIHNLQNPSLLGSVS